MKRRNLLSLITLGSLVGGRQATAGGGANKAPQKDPVLGSWYESELWDGDVWVVFRENGTADYVYDSTKAPLAIFQSPAVFVRATKARGKWKNEGKGRYSVDWDFGGGATKSEYYLLEKNTLLRSDKQWKARDTKTAWMRAMRSQDKQKAKQMKGLYGTG